MPLKTLSSSIDGVVPLKRTYDIRIRNAIATSRNPNLFPELNIRKQFICGGTRSLSTLKERSIRIQQELS
jgi:hypothetical protein